MKKKLLIVIVIALLIGSILMMKRFVSKNENGAISLSGNVEITEVNIGFKQSGRIVEMLAEEGRKVNKGDRLALLDSAELEGQVSQARAYLDETKARLEELRIGSRPQEIEQAKANLRYAEAELDKAKKDFERSDFLYKNWAISAQQMDGARKALDTAGSSHQKAAETLSLTREGPRREEIKAAENRVQQAMAGLRVSEERLKDTIIYAPVSGIILRKIRETGETVAPGSPVYVMGDIERPWIKVYVKEDRLGLVRLGQKAKVTTDSYTGKEYEGIVTYISSEAEFTPKNIQTKEERVKLVFGVKVSVNNSSYELKPGMPADVSILLR